MKRKRFLLLSAMLILVTFSCIDDEIENSTQEKEVMIFGDLTEEEVLLSPGGNIQGEVYGGHQVITAKYFFLKT